MAAKPKRRIDNWGDMPEWSQEAMVKHGDLLGEATASLNLPQDDPRYSDVWWEITGAVLEYIRGYRDAFAPARSEILERLESIRATAVKLDNLLTEKSAETEAPSLIPSIKDVFARVPECGESRFGKIVGRDILYSDTKIGAAHEGIRLIKMWTEKALKNEVDGAPNLPQKRDHRADFLRDISQIWCAAKDIEAPEIRNERADGKAIGPFADFAERCLVAAKAFSGGADEIASLIESRVALYRALKRAIDGEGENKAAG
jgi:hypothetical protein